MKKFALMCMMMSLMYPVYCNVEKRDVSSCSPKLLLGIWDRLDKLEKRIDKQGNGVQLRLRGGAIYTRWGRQSCPKGAELVYTGQAGGSHHGHSGAAANYLCLPFNPSWDKFNDAVSNHAYVYGAEIASDHQNIAGTPVDIKNHGQDVSCAVCRSRVRRSTLMIPGRNQCDKGWYLEYKGYLMAGRYSHPAASEYVCMDGDPQMLHGGQKGEWKNIFYIVEAQCGALKCPPYVQGREITCAVCTK